MKRICALVAFLCAFEVSAEAQVFIKQSTTATPLEFFLTDSADHISGKTGASPTVTISKNGASFVTPSGAVTELAFGWYKVAGNATDTNTLGLIKLHAQGSGFDPVDMPVAIVVGFDPGDAVRLGLTALPNANAAASNGLLTSGTAANQITTSSGQVTVGGFATDAISSAAVSAAAVTKIQTNLITITKNTTVSNYYFKLTKNGAAYTGGTSGTITCTVTKDGSAFAGCAAGTQSAITEVSVGWYKTNVQAADVNANILVLKFAVPTDSAVVPWEQEITPGR